VVKLYLLPSVNVMNFRRSAWSRAFRPAKRVWSRPDAKPLDIQSPSQMTKTDPRMSREQTIMDKCKRSNRETNYETGNSLMMSKESVYLLTFGQTADQAEGSTAEERSFSPTQTEGAFNTGLKMPLWTTCMSFAQMGDGPTPS
jgi:hypothetical protein